MKKDQAFEVNNSTPLVRGGVIKLGELFCLQKYFPRDEEIVYRYTSYHNFEDLIKTGKLYLTRGDQFDEEDNYEGSETQLSARLRRAVHSSNAVDEIDRLYKRNRRCVAINCWYVGAQESELMWNKFAKKSDDIAIRTDVGKIRSALLSWDRYLCVRKMEYTENHADEFLKFGCPFFPFSIKRKKDFGSENELRIIYGEGKGCIDESPLYQAQELADNNRKIFIDLKILIDKIVLAPNSNSSVRKKVEKILDGLDIPVVNSIFTNAKIP